MSENISSYPSTNRSIICITGGHRSGTSILTRLLAACGMDLGAESDLMPARADNPGGFWENLRFVQINDEILNACGSAWDLPPQAETDFGSSKFQPQRVKAEMLLTRFCEGESWGWKDPRNCLTIPFWKSLIPSLKVIHIVRNPLEVAYSMRNRNGTSYALGLRLWEIYNRRLLALTNPEERLVTSYDLFFERPTVELERLVRFAGLSLDKIPGAANLITASQRHTRFSREQLVDAGASLDLVALYQALLEESSGKHRLPAKGSDAIQTAEGAKRISAADPLYGNDSVINLAIPDSETVRRELALLRGSDLEHREKIKELEGRVDEVRERFLQTNRLLRDQSITLGERERDIFGLKEEFRKSLRETKRLLRILDDTAQAAELLRKSRRWAMANPFAALWAKLSGKSLPGFGHLDRTVTKYKEWRTAHPEMTRLDDAIAALRPRQDTGSGLASVFASRDFARSRGNYFPSPPDRPISFPSHQKPEVSIIIPVFNQVAFTEACLASIQRSLDKIDCEVIVVDDCSTDTTPEKVGSLPGVTYLRNESNQGFVLSSNRGAEAARGEYLLFLNNDTEVTPGWIAALRETFTLVPRAGIAGAKLVFPDGTLQEAGGIIWRDGSGWNRGKFQDPNDPQYNYLMEVDYCSGACLMIPRSLFRELGGFDLKYAPGYYEDTDLAFKVRKAGYKVLYQPLSKVIHYEGTTGGTDLTVGAKKYQVTNRETFINQWADVLATKPSNGDLLSLQTPEPGSKRILVIDHHLPMIDRDSGSLRMYQILTILQGLGHRVTFIPDNLSDIPPYGDNIRKRGIELLHHPYIPSVREYLQSHGVDFDVVILSRCDFARKHINDVRQFAPNAHVIFDTVDLHFLRLERQAAMTRDAELEAKAAEKRELEYDLIDKADETWVVSPFEQALLGTARPNRPVEVVSNIVEIPGSSAPFSARRDMLFIGSFQHPPNTDAVVYFAEQVFPRVREYLPEAKFFIIGEKAPPEVIALADEKIVITGLQPDVAPFFNSVKLSVAPLRYGAGVKGKVNQSMAYGVPVVASTIALEGMDLVPGQHILVADDPDSFAAAVIKVYNSEDLWERISSTALEHARERFSVAAARENLARIFNHNSYDPFPSEKGMTVITSNPASGSEPRILVPRA